MLDLFKNIISRKAKKPRGKFQNSTPLSPSTSKESNSGSLSSTQSNTSLGMSDDDTGVLNDKDMPIHETSIELLLEIHPELNKYYKELHPRYLLSDVIGEGAFSQVYKAYDTKEKRYLAIKIINKTGMKPAQINSTLKEIAIMRQLNHKNIVKLYNYQNSSNSKYCFLFMEFVSGGEIFNQIIKYTYFSEELSRHVIRQVAFAVKYLHDNGIVHRDIKPENILFEPSVYRQRSKKEQLRARRVSDDNNKIDEGEFSIKTGAGGIGLIKLADFGLSTVLPNAGALAKTPCGTVGYTSPEQHMNVGYDKKVDMWALGCVLYTMVVGFPPFYSNDQNTNDITEKVMNGRYEFLKPWFDEVSDGCKNLISNLLTVDPEKRYSIEQMINDPWFNIGYDDVPIGGKVSTPAADAPQSTYNNELYQKFSESLINTNNVDDYFSGNQTSNSKDGNGLLTPRVPLLTPRAEAIKLVFDTAKRVTPMSRSVSPSRSDGEKSLSTASHATAETLTTHTSVTRQPSMKSFKSILNGDHGTSSATAAEKASEYSRPRKTSISFSINEHSRRSGSITSSSSHLSHTSSDLGGSADFINAHPLVVNEIEEEDTEDETTDGNTMNLSTPHNNKLKHEEFRAKCMAHTPYVPHDEGEDKHVLEDTSSVSEGSRRSTPPNELINRLAPQISLEQKLQEHSV
ncbi:Serine/threonine-protein kinase srk1, partial [Pichia kudriavzevii]